MPAVHLQKNKQTNFRPCSREKGYLCWVLNLTDENGRESPNGFPPIRKSRVTKPGQTIYSPPSRREWTEKLLQEATASQQSASPSGPSSAEISFVDFLYQWLEYKYKSAGTR